MNIKIINMILNRRIIAMYIAVITLLFAVTPDHKGAMNILSGFSPQESRGLNYTMELVCFTTSCNKHSFHGYRNKGITNLYYDQIQKYNEMVYAAIYRCCYCQPFLSVSVCNSNRNMCSTRRL